MNLLGSFHGSQIHSPNAVVLAKESGTLVQEHIVNFLPVIHEIKERSRGGVMGWVGAAAVDMLGMVVVMVEHFTSFSGLDMC